jgi:endonuclease/exonuclease/phosphatase family metal-dependent hydrolase
MNLKIASFITLLFTGNIAWSQSADSNRIIIKVLSFNIYHGATTLNNYDLNKIAKVIKDADPDFVALQEVDYYTVRNGRHDLVCELGYKLKMIPLFGRSMYFNGGEYGLGILSKYTFSKTRSVILPETQGKEPRTALEIISVLPTGDTIAFIGTHFDHQNENDRIAQAKKINEEFTSVRYPAILAGDLNAIPGSTPINILEELWLPTYDINNPEATFPSSKTTVKIDYVMLYPKEKWKTLKSEVICDSIASDHCALLVTTELLK